MDTISFQIKAIEPTHTKEFYSLWIGVVINNILLNPNLNVDIFNIIKMLDLKASNEYYSMWTCDCGELGCANIEPVNIKRIASKIYYPLFDEISCPNSIPYHEWMKARNIQVLSIYRDDLANQLLKLADDIEIFVSNKKDKMLSHYLIGIDLIEPYEPILNLPAHIRLNINNHMVIK